MCIRDRLGTVLNELEKECKPGVTTYHINKIGEEMIKSYGCIPSFKGYQWYPAAICVSVNDEIVHGIPSKKRCLLYTSIISEEVVDMAQVTARLLVRVIRDRKLVQEHQDQVSKVA